MRHLALFSVLILTSLVRAQYNFEFNDSLPVFRGGVQLDNPWGGGLNYAQFSDIDFDFDGDMDLFVFDRSNNNVRLFEQKGTAPNQYYEIVYNAQNLFPADLRYRATMVDYDNDGRKDLFTYGIGGLKVFRNVGDGTNGLQWELFKNIINSDYPNGTSNLLVYSSDIPAIIDVDGDGDVDILTFGQSGTHMEYHQNQSMENYGVVDSLEFILMNQCWGKFSEDINTNTLYLNDPNYPCVGGDIPNPESGLQKSEKHLGATVLALDIDNSGVMDIVIGDASYPNLNLLINGGSAPNTDSPMTSVDPSFPSNTTPVDVQLFPASYFVDVDFDGIKDLIVAPNARNISENETSVLFYKNMGSNNLPNFSFVQNDFLQDEMIEVGVGSIPVFVDINEDGLKDLIVSNLYRYKPILDKESVLRYYLNTGTASNPELTYIDDDFLNLSSAGYGLHIVPTFGDLDGDGDDDMLLGIENGSLVYYENESTGSGASYITAVPNFTDNLGQTINEGTFSFPQLFDLDKDGLLDLIIGKRNGEIAFYKNIGSSTNPSFELNNANLGNVDVTGTSGNPDGYAAPHFTRRNDTTFLFVGNLDGTLAFFEDIDDNIGVGDSFTMTSFNYLGIDVEAYSSFAIEDMDNDGNLELYVGQDLGGIYRFESDPNSSVGLTENPLIQQWALYPNPSNGKLVVNVNDNKISSISIQSSDGGLVHFENTENLKSELDLQHLSNGVYFVKVEFQNGVTSQKKWIKL